jgi:hypothetical protein
LVVAGASAVNGLAVVVTESHGLALNLRKRGREGGREAAAEEEKKGRA